METLWFKSAAPSVSGVGWEAVRLGEVSGSQCLQGVSERFDTRKDGSGEFLASCFLMFVALR